MRAPMRQQVTVFIPKLDENGALIPDKYGRPKTIAVTSKARVQFRSSLIRDAKGQEKRVSLEIELPPEIDPPEGSKIEYVTICGQTAAGTILAKEEATNLAGTKVYYRTVFVDG